MSKSTPVLIKFSLVAVIIAAVLAYVFFNTRIFIAGPQIIIESPVTGMSTSESLIQIKGQVLHSSFISINDRAISVNDEGYFTEQLLLLDGYNVVIIKAKDKFERQVTKKLDLVYNREERIEVPEIKTEEL